LKVADTLDMTSQSDSDPMTIPTCAFICGLYLLEIMKEKASTITLMANCYFG